MVNQLWVMIEGRGDLLSARWSCHYLMNNEPLPAIHTHAHTHAHTQTYHLFTPSLHFLILAFFPHGQMAFTVPPSAKRQEYFCLPMPTTYSVKVQLPELWIKFVIWWTDIIILFGTTTKQGKSWQTFPGDYVTIIWKPNKIQKRPQANCMDNKNKLYGILYISIFGYCVSMNVFVYLCLR